MPPISPCEAPPAFVGIWHRAGAALHLSQAARHHAVLGRHLHHPNRSGAPWFSPMQRRLTEMRASSVEIVAALVGVLSGMVVSISLAPKDQQFAGNFFFTWLPQLLVLSVVSINKPRPAVHAGAACALAAHLAGFGWWVSSLQQSSGMVWLGYLFALPSGAGGGIAAAVWLRTRPKLNAFVTAGVGALGTLGGLIVGQLIACGTVLSCGGY